MDRRTFMNAAAAGSALGLPLNRLLAAETGSSQTKPPLDRICLFTDLVDDFGYSFADVAGMLRQLKIAGPDLTVRDGGLIKPEQARAELPEADKVFRDHGLSIPMLTTGITSASDPVNQAILASMQQLGIRFYKLGYYRYRDYAKWSEDLEVTRAELEKLAVINERNGLEAGFHNHAGDTVGGAMWDLAMLFERIRSPSIGSFFDPAHATIEGSESGWKLGFHRLSPRFKMIAIKDFIREKHEGRWRVRWCPLGEGMVRWPEFFELLKQIPFTGPISLHIEYDPGGRTKVERLDNSLRAAESDLAFLRARLREAYPDA